MSNAPTLQRLILDFRRGHPLPERVGSMSLQQWLDSKRHDQREFAFPGLAISIGVATERPWIGEVASALKFRLEEGNVR